MDELVCVATFTSRMDAELAQAVLESQGIRASVEVDDAGSMLPPLAGAGAGVFVHAADESAAREALDGQTGEPEGA